MLPKSSRKNRNLMKNKEDRITATIVTHTYFDDIKVNYLQWLLTSSFDSFGRVLFVDNISEYWCISVCFSSFFFGETFFGHSSKEREREKKLMSIHLNLHLLDQSHWILSMIVKKPCHLQYVKTVNTRIDRK